MSPAISPKSRLLPGVAFFGHAPALWLFARFRLNRPTQRRNVVAVISTLVVMAIGGFLRGGWGVLLAWLVGHFVWGGFLALYVLRGTAGTSDASGAVS